jgi:hypothetical protein
MSVPAALYKAFTGDGVLADRWEASGVKSTYDPVTTELTLEMPTGWTDIMPIATRETRNRDWCIDHPTFNVEYRLHIRDGTGAKARDVKLVAIEHDDGTIEFRTNIDFQPMRDIARGSALLVDLVAHVAVVKGAPVVLPLMQGRAIVPHEQRWLGRTTQGFFFVVESGINLSIHSLGDEDILTLTHVSFLGRAANLEQV